MPDPIPGGANSLTPMTLTPYPPMSSPDAFLSVGSAPQTARRPLSSSQTWSEISKRCRKLRLSAGVTQTLQKSLRLTGIRGAHAGAGAKDALKMLASLETAVGSNPRLPAMERDQYVILWSKLKKRPDAQRAWAQLAQQPHFWNRMNRQNRRVAATHLAKATIPPSMVAKGINKIALHHLFASANPIGKHNALADLCDSAKLLNANTLPDAAKLKKQAPALMKKHLGHMQPASRAILHRQVMAKAALLQKAFFEFKPGSKSKQVWGDRFVNAYGGDWYKQCVSMILTQSARNACRSTFKMIGANRGADVVCGMD